MKVNEHIHFVGIGGYGMSAIAKVALEMGYTVTGSDVAVSALLTKLQELGAKVTIGHRPENIAGATTVVYSTAVTADNVELVAARKQPDITVLHRSDMLAKLLNNAKGIAVAGAHGKTTTSSMIAFVMNQTGHDPTYIIGGEVVNLGTNAQAGKGDYLVAEADESDGSFLKYYPSIAVVTNIEADHLENYDGDFENIKRAYVQFLRQVKPDGKLVVCLDDDNVQSLLPKVFADDNVKQEQLITYGISSTEATYRAIDIIEGDRQISFTLLSKNESLGSFVLAVPGLHNVYNAMATIISALEAGVELEAIRKAIAIFTGAKRRFQVIADEKDMLIVDDYAHHPTEIVATLRAAKATGKKVKAIFQPQRFSRTYFLLDEFSKAFPEADEVIITDIYSPAGEVAIEGINSAKLVSLIKEQGQTSVRYIPSKEEVIEVLKQEMSSGDIIITMGAGDIYKVSYALADHLSS